MYHILEDQEDGYYRDDIQCRDYLTARFVYEAILNFQSIYTQWVIVDEADLHDYYIVHP